MMTRTGWTVMADMWVGREVVQAQQADLGHTLTMEKEGELKDEGKIWGFGKCLKWRVV